MFVHDVLGHRRSLASGLILAAGIAAVLTAAPAFAATWTWDGGAGNDNWTNGQNWVGDVGPANDGTADIIFAGTTRLTPNLPVNWSINSLTFNNTAGFFDLVTSNGSTLTVGAGGITNNGANVPEFEHAIALSAPQTWNAALGAIIFDGTIQNNGHLLTLNVEPPRQILLNSPISGSGGLTKNGLGELFLAMSPKSYGGTTRLNAGAIVIVGFPNSIPGSLEIGDGVGTAIDVVIDFVEDTIADSATVSVLSTGKWHLKDSTSEAITNLNIESAGIAGGGLVTLDAGTLTVLETLTMTGGAVTATSAGTLRFTGGLDAHYANFAATISSKLDLDAGVRTFTVADGATPNDLDVTGVVSNGGIIKAGPGALRLGAANTYADGTILNAGTILVGHDVALGTGPLTGNGGTLRADGATRTIANEVDGVFGVDGAFDLALSSPLHGDLAKNGPGTLVFASGGTTANSLSVNAGAVRVDAPFTVAAGLTNSATVLLGTQTLMVNGAGFNNQGSLPLAGGTLAGSGPVVNSGLISGNGTIGGTGGLTNNAQLIVSGGNLTLAKAGANANAGNVVVQAGLQLRLTGSMLANTGAIILDGGAVAGTATLSNIAGGIVSGRGMISAPLANAGGTLRAVGGTLNVTTAFATSGVIRLDDAASLVGGAITNTGLIHGDGTIANALTNAAGGSIRVDVGKTLLVTGAFAANVGEINLQGGALDFSGAITNAAAGFIAGRGALYSGGLTNSGQMAFSGGAADVHGDVTLTTGARVVTSGAGSVTTFFDDVVHNGLTIFTGASASTVFFGSQSGAGSFTGTGTVYYIGDLRPGNSPGTVDYDGSVVLGSETTLMVELGGVAAGAQYDQIRVTGDLSLGGELAVSLINGFSPSAGQLFNILDWGSRGGSFSALNLPTLGGSLMWNTSQLYTSGILSVAPAFTADFDHDGDVDANDLAVWKGTFHVDALADADGDIDSDGADFLAWQRQLNLTVPWNSAKSPIPEPATLWPFTVLAASVRTTRRQTLRKLVGGNVR